MNIKSLEINTPHNTDAQQEAEKAALLAAEMCLVDLSRVIDVYTTYWFIFNADMHN